MAAEARINDIQDQLEALFELVCDQPEHKAPYPKPTLIEGNQIKAVKREWLKSICCLNLIKAHELLKPVWQSLEERLEALRAAIDEWRALRFDVLMLGIASHGIPALQSGPSSH